MRRSAVRFRYRARDQEICLKRDSFFVFDGIFGVGSFGDVIVGVEALGERLRGLGCLFWGRARARLRDDVMGLALWEGALFCF